MTFRNPNALGMGFAPIALAVLVGGPLSAVLVGLALWMGWRKPLERVQAKTMAWLI